MWCIVRPDATEDEINDTIDSGNADRIFADKTVDKQKAAETALSYIRVRCVYPSHTYLLAHSSSLRIVIKRL